MAARQPFTAYGASGRHSLLNPDSPSGEPGPSTSATRRPSSTPSSPGSPSPDLASASPEASRAGKTAKERKKHTCKVCDRHFTTSGHLTRHAKLHTGDKPFVCPYPNCDKKCSRDDNLAQHFRVHLPKHDRKRGVTYVRESIAQMREATDISTAVLQLAGLIPWPSKPVDESPDRMGEVLNEEGEMTRRREYAVPNGDYAETTPPVVSASSSPEVRSTSGKRMSVHDDSSMEPKRQRRQRPPGNSPPEAGSQQPVSPQVTVIDLAASSAPRGRGYEESFVRNN